jgi:predicted dehydrogenase
MNSENRPSTRREFLKNTGRIAAVSALAGVAIPRVYAAEDNTIQVALIGCGGRGTGAARNALSVKHGPVKLVAMADVFPDRLKDSFDRLKKHFGDKGDQIDVPADRQFIGLDAYQKAMDCLKPGDVAIFTTPPAFRWVHFGYAIGKGLNVFMEKPVTVDGPTTRKMLALGEESVKKNLKVGVGLMCRHALDRIELRQRIQQGDLGDIIAMRAYRMHDPAGFFSSKPKPDGISELMYQIQRFHSFIWASGGCFSDFYIHNIDECCMMKDAWPVKAQALGGRHYRKYTVPDGDNPYRGDSIDQNFDTYSVEYTFADGTKLFLNGRTIYNCYPDHSSWIHGTKGSALVSINGHSHDKCRIFKNQDARLGNKQLVWKYSKPGVLHYQLEWDELIDAIRQDKPYNEVKRGAEASLVTSMGRMAAHTGQVVTYDDMLKCDHEMAPTVDKLTADSPAPLLAGPDGKYPVPQPGIVTKREY